MINIKNAAKILDSKPDLLARQVILDTAQNKNQIIYGGKAINQQLPVYLRKDTSDYDILTKKPKKAAIEIANKLNKYIGRKEFTVEPAQHKGTYKIKYRGETIADYTQLKRNPKVTSVFGNKYYDIKSIKKNVQRLIKKEETKYRRGKDLSTLQRIQELEEIEKKFNL